MIDKVHQFIKNVDNEEREILIKCNILLTRAYGILYTNEGPIYIAIKPDTYVITDRYVRDAYNGIIKVLNKYGGHGGKKQTRTIKKSKKQQKKPRKSRAKSHKKK
jgi:hypothetical protein